MTDYIHDAALVADSASFQRAPNASITVYDADDATNAVPLVLKDLNGLPLPNPLTSSQDAFTPAFITSSAQVKLVGGGLTVVLNSFQGLLEDALAAQIEAQAAKAAAIGAQAAAETAGADAAEAAAAALAGAVEDAETARAAAEAAAALVGAPADTAISTAINAPTSATRSALNAAIQSQVEAGRLDSVDAVFAALDYRAGTPLVFVSCSDSTGDQDNEWYELSLKESFASLWPDRAVDLKRWNKAGEAFYSTVPWQTGIFSATSEVVYPAAILYKDMFNRTGYASGSSPDVGIPYTSTNGTSYSTDGSKLVLTAGGTISQFLIQPSIPAETPDFKLTADLAWAYNGSGFSSGEIWVGKDITNYLRLHVEGTSSATATLRKNIAGTLTTIATFANPVFNGVLSSQAVSLELAGTTVTAKIGTETVTGTLSAGEVTALTGATREVRYRTSAANYGVDNVILTGQKTISATSEINPGLPKVTVYNGGAAGETTAYHRARIAAMYPEQPDLVFINHGHNYLAASTPADVQADFELFLDALFAVWQPCPVVVISQNPEFGTGKETAHKGWMLALRGYARRKGWGYIPTYEAFMKLPDGGSSEIPDGLHPAIGTGRRRQADAAKAWIKSISKRP